ncbi:chemotaxis protein CheW [Halopiger goleimassiliensis]|uniref:chemotaxis protein CheW n=1 Tax=Halopiger goleimassiliensis TaxID=1293048 RepID=UPI0006775EC1|nr:chemotaxis protein CheW [Halopiger goleimassiliensis]
MTDDRARRIRDLRNRRASSDDDAADDEQTSSADEQPAVADGDGSDPSDGSTTETSETDESDEAESAADDAPERTDADDDPAVDEQPESEPAEATDGAEETDDAETDPEQVPEAGSEPDDADDVPTEAVAEATTAAAPAPTDADGEAGQSLSFEESAAIGTPDSSAGDGLQPMVDADQATQSAFGGAIASDDVLSEFVDDVGTEGAGGGAAAVEAGGYGSRGAAVFEQGDTLVASAHDDEAIQMLEFYLNDNRYAIEIDRISAIVEMKEITRFPRGPDAIDGVTDLRGEITAVLDPTALLDVERNELSDDQYIVVLERDDDKQKLGIRVTDVSQAVTYRESQIDETAAAMDSANESQHEFINGIVKKPIDDRTALVTWLDIDAIIENTD